LPVESIDTHLVMQVLEPIWNTKHETARRIRGRIENVLDWAKTREYRDGENPARWRGHLQNLLQKRSKIAPVVHHAALPYREVSAFMAALRALDNSGARALELLILTASRSGEVLKAKWSEFDLTGRLWTIPAERMKASKEHRVPLSAAVLAVLEKQAAIRVNDHVFAAARGTGHADKNTLAKVLKRRGRSGTTVHGFRSTFSDWCAECTVVPSEVREMALAHTVGNAVENAYRRGDMFAKRRALAEA
jgi:integrase